MEAKPLVPAAQYVRMSTEDQQYSIANQEAAIQIYARSHGYFVLSTYADAGNRMRTKIEIERIGFVNGRFLHLRHARFRVSAQNSRPSESF